MSTTTENRPDTSAGDELALPDYAATVAECGDPQPILDELAVELDAQTPPTITDETDEDDDTSEVDQ